MTYWPLGALFLEVFEQHGIKNLSGKFALSSSSFPILVRMLQKIFNPMKQNGRGGGKMYAYSLGLWQEEDVRETEPLRTPTSYAPL